MRASRTPTYERLRKEIERLGRASAPQDKGALDAVREHFGAEFDHLAPIFLADEEEFEAFVTSLTNAMRSPKGGAAAKGTRKQRATQLRRVRKVARELADVGDVGWDTLPRAIRSCRRRVDGCGISQKEMAARFGDGLRRYEHGRFTPTTDNLKALHDLADAAGVEREALDRFAVPARRRQNRSRAGTGESPPNYSLAALGYALPHDPNPRDRQGNAKAELPDCPLKTEIADLIEYKTAAVPPRSLKRPERSRWTQNGQGENHGKQAAVRMLSQFYGWLHGVLGVPLDGLTLAMAADAVVVARYHEFLLQRGSSAGATQMIRHVSLPLVRGAPQGSRQPTGFIRQQRRAYRPAVLDDRGYLGTRPIRDLYVRHLAVPEGLKTPRDIIQSALCWVRDLDDEEDLEAALGDLKERTLFDEWCEFNLQELRNLQKMSEKASDKIPMKRRVQELVRQRDEWKERPIRLARSLVRDLRAEHAAYGDDREASDSVAIDIALIAFVAGLPLRENNVRSVRLHPSLVHEEARPLLPDYTPSLFPTDEDGLLFREHVDYFKNRSALRKRNIRHFEMPIFEWVVPIIRAYLIDVRPKLEGARAGSPYLFPSLRSASRDPLVSGTLADRVRLATARHLGEENEFGIHLLRHLVATDITVSHPGALNFVADLLQDDLETVRFHYDASDPSDAARFASSHQLSEMRDLAEEIRTTWYGKRGRLDHWN